MADLNNFQKAYKRLEEAQQFVAYEAGLYGHGGDVPAKIGEASGLIQDAQNVLSDLGWPDEQESTQ